MLCHAGRKSLQRDERHPSLGYVMLMERVDDGSFIMRGIYSTYNCGNGSHIKGVLTHRNFPTRAISRYAMTPKIAHFRIRVFAPLLN